jgi:hypothetical protein
LNQTFLCVVNDSNKNIALNFINFGKFLKGYVSFFDGFLNKFKEKLGENLNDRKTLLINEKPVDIWL